MVVPIEVGKNYNNVLVVNDFGCLLKDPFVFNNIQEGFRFLHNIIANISKNKPVEKIPIGMEATGHYFKIL